MKLEEVSKKIEQSEYEKMRENRIAENEEMFKQLFSSVECLKTPERKKSGKIRPNTDRQSRKVTMSPYPSRRNPSRSCKGKRKVFYGSDNDDDDRSSDYCMDEDNNDDDDDVNKKNSFVVRLWSAKQNIVGSPEKRKRLPPRVTIDRNEMLEKYELLTEDDLVLVAERTSDKRYDQNGTTCHQCRQKTDDLKTICKEPKCFGVRGQFCGPCLRNRYGEDAKEAIMDKNWVCPPCRGICNCSFCMAKRGRKATGILIHIAKDSGYDSVKSFLGD